MIKNSYNKAFTIVELLIVVVVIAILATITIVSYNGIQRQASEAVLKSDLRQASVLIESHHVNNGSYPDSNSGANAGGLLKPSDGVTFNYTSTSDTYCLTASSNRAGVGPFYVSNSSGIQEGECDDSASSSTVRLAAGSSHSMTISSDNIPYSWGRSNFGQLGNNSTTNSPVPVAITTSGVLAGKTITQISLGTNHSLALASDGTVYSWGYNNFGQLGNNSTANSLVPVAVTNSGALAGKTITQISSGTNHSLALDSDGNVYAWGQNNFGQLGNNSTTNSLVPVAVTTSGALAGKTITQIAAGNQHSLVLASDNTQYSWGRNNYSQLGNNSTEDSLVPVAVTTSGAMAGKTIVQITSGSQHSLALANDGTLYSWGYNNLGQLGNNSTTNSPVPVSVTTSGALTGKTITQIAAGANHSLALTSDGRVYSWGPNNYGQLGNNSTANSLVPVAVTNSGALAGKTITQIVAGGNHSLALDSDGTVYSWGYNNYGQLGNDSTIDSLVPVLVQTNF